MVKFWEGIQIKNISIFLRITNAKTDFTEENIPMEPYFGKIYFDIAMTFNLYLFIFLR